MSSSSRRDLKSQTNAWCDRSRQPSLALPAKPSRRLQKSTVTCSNRWVAPKKQFNNCNVLIASVLATIQSYKVSSSHPYYCIHIELRKKNYSKPGSMINKVPFTSRVYLPGNKSPNIPGLPEAQSFESLPLIQGLNSNICIIISALSLLWHVFLIGIISSRT